MISGIASPRLICQGYSGYSPHGHSTRKEKHMKRWESDPDLRRLVTEKREGGLDRRAFLARLGGATAGAAAASLIRGWPPGQAAKEIHVDRCGTPPKTAYHP